MAAYGRGTGSIWMSYVDCTGLESHLGQCGYKPWGKNTCSHGEDAGVMCVPETCKHGYNATKYKYLKTYTFFNYNYTLVFGTTNFKNFFIRIYA